MSLLLVITLLAGCFMLEASAVTTTYNAGDVDMDSSIGTADARRILRMSLKLGTYSIANEKLADVDGDGDIEPSDARKALRISVGLDKVDTREVSVLTAEKKTKLNYVPSIPEKSKEHGTFTLTVYGYGHGVGMPQYGAVELAKNGFYYTRILKHYYSGVEIQKDPDYRTYTNYCGSSISTKQLVARIVYGEIYGITDYGKYMEACKAQAVAVYTLLKYYNFNVSQAGSVGYAGAATYDGVPDALKKAVNSVIGKYMYMADDPAQKPILSVYSAAAGGKSCSSKDIWGGYLPYLEPVDSSFELDIPAAVTTYELSKEYVRNRILSYDSSIVLSDDPSEWIRILAHSGSVDSERGYITRAKVGNKEVSGFTLSTRIFPYYRAGSTCMYFQYTP